MSPDPSPREHAVVVFGATGFTGRLTAERLAERAGDTPRFALAGRSHDRLLEVREALAETNPACADLPLLQADVNDPKTVEAMARATRVVVSTVGPYERYGEPVVRACAEAGTHYADLTGEGGFVERMIAGYDTAARASGARIVNGCGFDSIPADLGTLFTVQRLPKDAPLEVSAYVEMAGERRGLRDAWQSVSGGTWHSALGFLNVREWRRARASVVRIGREAGAGRRVGLLPDRVHTAPEPVGGYAAPLPTIDREVVLRSAAALPEYGPDFRYGHHLRVGSAAALTAMGLGASTLFTLAQVPPVRRWLLSLKQPGEGPPPEVRARNAFRVTFVGTAPGARVVTRVSGGDPGYGETSVMLAETALCLAEDPLPERAGVLTPAVALGDALIQRLIRAGVVFEVLDQGGAAA